MIGANQMMHHTPGVRANDEFQITKKQSRLRASLLVIVFPAILLLGSCGGGSDGQSSVTATIPSNINAIQLISVSASGGAPNGDSDSASSTGISMGSPLAPKSGGLYVAFASKASNLISGDTNGVSDVFLRQTRSEEHTSELQSHVKLV